MAFGGGGGAGGGGGGSHEGFESYSGLDISQMNNFFQVQLWSLQCGIMVV